jgi:hypothetical protein
MCHLAATELQLHPDFVSPIKKFFTVPDFRQVIVIVDVYAKLNFLQFRARGFFFFFLLGNAVTEFAEIDDFADWRLRGRRDFDEIQSEALRFS